MEETRLHIDRKVISAISHQLDGDWRKPFSLATTLAILLDDASRFFGPSMEPYPYFLTGIDFEGSRAHVSYFGVGKNNDYKFVKICLSESDYKDSRSALWNLVHECVHLISPKGRDPNTMLHEGMACWYASLWLKVCPDLFPSWAQDALYGENRWNLYDESLHLVTQLLKSDPISIKRIREVETRVTRITPELISKTVPGIDPDLPTKLVASGDFWKNPSLQNHKKLLAAGARASSRVATSKGVAARPNRSDGRKPTFIEEDVHGLPGWHLTSEGAKIINPDENIGIGSDQVASVSFQLNSTDLIACLFKQFDAESLGDRRVRFRGYTKTEGTVWGGQFLVRIYDHNGACMFKHQIYYLHSPNLALSELSFEVPTDAKFIEVEVLCKGPGKVWVLALTLDESLVAAPPLSIGMSYARSPFNLDFAMPCEENQFLNGWLNWKGSVAPGSYEWSNSSKLSIDFCQAYLNKPVGYIRSSAKNRDDFAAAIQTFKADDFRGKRVCFSGYIKTSKVTEKCTVFVECSSAQSMQDKDQVETRPLGTNTEWAKFEIYLRIPFQSDEITIGVKVFGGGAAFLSGLAFAEMNSELTTSFFSLPVKQRGAKIKFNLLAQSFSSFFEEAESLFGPAVKPYPYLFCGTQLFAPRSEVAFFAKGEATNFEYTVLRLSEPCFSTYEKALSHLAALAVLMLAPAPKLEQNILEAGLAVWYQRRCLVQIPLRQRAQLRASDPCCELFSSRADQAFLIVNEFMKVDPSAVRILRQTKSFFSEISASLIVAVRNGIEYSFAERLAAPYQSLAVETISSLQDERKSSFEHDVPPITDILNFRFHQNIWDEADSL